MKSWLWLIKTNKGEFFITVVGDWTQEEAAKKLRLVFEKIELDITAMIPRKRATGPDDAMALICEQDEPKNEMGLFFFGSKKLWEACGQGVVYEAELIRLKKENEQERS